MSKTKFITIYSIWWAFTYVISYLKIGIAFGMASAMHSRGSIGDAGAFDTMSIVFSIATGLCYVGMTLGTNKWGIVVGKRWLISLPIISGVFDAFIGIPMIPSILCIVGLILGVVSNPLDEESSFNFKSMEKLEPNQELSKFNQSVPAKNSEKFSSRAIEKNKNESETDVRSIAATLISPSKNSKNRNKLILGMMVIIGLVTIFIYYPKIGSELKSKNFSQTDSQIDSRKGIYRMFDPQNVGAQIAGLERKYNAIPIKKWEHEGYEYRIYDEDNCHIKTTNVAKTGEVIELTTNCKNQFQDYFKIENGIKFEHIVWCFYCGNAANTKFIFRIGASHATPWVKDYVVFDIDKEMEWKHRIEAKLNVNYFEINDEMVNCNEGLKVDAIEMWKIENVAEVSFKQSPTIDEIACKK